MFEMLSAMGDNLLSLMRYRNSTPVNEMWCAPLHTEYVTFSELNSQPQGLDSHVSKVIANAFEDVCFFNTGTSVVEAWRINHYDGFSINRGLDDADTVSAGLEAISDILPL